MSTQESKDHTFNVWHGRILKDSIKQDEEGHFLIQKGIFVMRSQGSEYLYIGCHSGQWLKKSNPEAARWGQQSPWQLELSTQVTPDQVDTNLERSSPRKI